MIKLVLIFPHTGRGMISMIFFPLTHPHYWQMAWVGSVRLGRFFSMIAKAPLASLYASCRCFPGWRWVSQDRRVPIDWSIDQSIVRSLVGWINFWELLTFLFLLLGSFDELIHLYDTIDLKTLSIRKSKCMLFISTLTDYIYSYSSSFFLFFLPLLSILCRWRSSHQQMAW